MNVFGWSVSFIIYFIYIFTTNNNDIYGYFKSLDRTWGIPTFYIYIFTCVVVLLTLNQIYYILKRELYPGIKDKIINYLPIGKSKEDYNKILQKWREQDQQKEFMNFVYR